MLEDLLRICVKDVRPVLVHQQAVVVVVVVGVPPDMGALVHQQHSFVTPSPGAQRSRCRQILRLQLGNQTSVLLFRKNQTVELPAPATSSSTRNSSKDSQQPFGSAALIRVCILDHV